MKSTMYTLFLTVQLDKTLKVFCYDTKSSLDSEGIHLLAAEPAAIGKLTPGLMCAFRNFDILFYSFPNR